MRRASASARSGAPETVDADTVFQIASLSKPVTATIVARQVQAGVVGWDTPVAKHLPWFKLKDPWVTTHVTIGDLLSHRSGLPDHAGDTLEDLGFDRRQVLERLRLLPLAPFRISYAYTNFGFTAGAEATAVASGKDWATLSEDALVQAARHDLDQRALCRFRKAEQPRLRSREDWPTAFRRNISASPTRRRRPAASVHRSTIWRAGSRC